MPCNYVDPLLCMQTGTGPALPNFATAGKKVFVTSTSYTGDLGGLAGGDAKCHDRALASGFTTTANPKIFKAWLSDTATDAKDRLTSNGPWVRPDGFKIADTKADLLDGLLYTSISQNELGAYARAMVWTGTDSNGIKNADRCNDWTDGTAGFNGRQGFAPATNGVWSAYPIDTCNVVKLLYCFED